MQLEQLWTLLLFQTHILYGFILFTFCESIQSASQRGASRYYLLTEPVILAVVQSPLQERDPMGIQVVFHSGFNLETDCELVGNPFISMGNFQLCKSGF